MEVFWRLELFFSKHTILTWNTLKGWGMGALVSQAQDMFLIKTVSLRPSGYDTHQVTSYMRQSRTCKPQKPIVRKNRDRVPPTKYSDATFGLLRLTYSWLALSRNKNK